MEELAAPTGDANVSDDTGWLGLVCQNPFLNELPINTVAGEKMLENTIKLGIPSLRN